MRIISLLILFLVGAATNAEEKNEIQVEGLGDVEIVGLQASCGEKSVCDAASHLKCFHLTCHCDKEKGYILDEVTGEKCIHTDDKEELDNYTYEDESEEDEGEDEVTKEKDEKWPEDESVWKLPEGSKGPVPKDNSRAAEQDDDEEEAHNASVAGSEKKEDKVPANIQQDVGPGPNHDEEKDETWPKSGGEDEGDWNLRPDNGEQKEPISCQTDTDCQNSTLGTYSVCKDNHCKCSDQTTLVKSTCIVWKEIDSPCETNEECDATIEGDAFCHLDQASGSRYCTCRPFNVWDDAGRQCLPIAVQGTDSMCLIDEQCSASDALGPLAECSEDKGKCGCKNGEFRKIFLFEDQCVEEKAIGDNCANDQECEASLGYSTFCHPETLKCACIPGRVCLPMILPTMSVMSTFTMFVLIVICLTAFITSVVCLVMKRREKNYAWVQLQNEA